MAKKNRETERDTEQRDIEREQRDIERKPKPREIEIERGRETHKEKVTATEEHRKRCRAPSR